MATLYETNGTTREVTPANGVKFTLEEMYALLGCEIVEWIPLAKNQVAVIDESGLLHRRAINHKATEILLPIFERRGILHSASGIVGPVLIGKRKELGYT